MFTRKIALRNWEISCIRNREYEKAHRIRCILDDSDITLFDYLAKELKGRIRQGNVYVGLRTDLEMLAIEEKEINDLICKLKEVCRESYGDNKVH